MNQTYITAVGNLTVGLRGVYVALILLGLLLFSMCGSSRSYNPSAVMAFDSVTYVDQFPANFELRNPTNVDVDIIGMIGFKCVDSLLIVAAQNSTGMWSFLSMPEHNYLGKYLMVGNGPSEVSSFVYPTSESFVKEDGDLHAAIFCMSKRVLLDFNISKTLRENHPDISVEANDFPPLLFLFERIDSTTYFCRQLSAEQNRQVRFLLRNGVEMTPPNFEQLNRATITQGKDVNILAILSQYNPERKRMVEVALAMNVINIYSLDGSFRRTVCIGDKLDNIDEIQDIPRWQRKDTFVDIRLFPDFFGVVYVNESRKAMQTLRKQKPVIQLYNYDGVPLATINTNTIFSDFDIDFVNKRMYTLNPNTEEFVYYDISDILTRFE